MINVLTYRRVSSDEQSLGFSLSDQQDKLNRYCALNNYSIVGEYTEDFSAKSFDRPAFTKLLTFIKKNKGLVTQLVFIKWDRFSRNATDALIMIRQLRALGVECIAIEQQLDFTVPESKLMLAIYLTSPEIENDRRSLNITAGIRRSLKEGRYCNQAPYGYKYGRDDRNKPILIQDPIKAPLAKEAFELLASGLHTKYEVMHIMRGKGMKMEKTRFCGMFHVPLYCGKILIKAYKNEPEEVVTGIHEAIISEELFEKIQFITGTKRAISAKPKTAKDELPLRGHLLCPLCGHNLTGSASKSRNGTRHFYYHCRNGCPTRFRADEANQRFETWLQDVSLKPEHINEYLALFENISKREEGDRKHEASLITEKINSVEECLLKANKKFINDEIDVASYKQLKTSYQEELSLLKIRKANLANIDADHFAKIEFALEVMSSLYKLWAELDIHGKRLLIGSTFPDKLIFSGNTYRTTLVQKNLAELFSIDEGCEGGKKEMAPISESHSASVEDNGVEPMTSCMP